MAYLTQERTLTGRKSGLRLTKRASRMKKAGSFLGQGFLLLVTSASALAVLFILYYIARDALPFFKTRGLGELIGSTNWYPSRGEGQFGALALFVGSGLVTLGAAVVAVPFGIAAAVCLSDILPFRVRQWVKPVIEILAAVPSVAYGFFALVILAPLLQDHGGNLLEVFTWLVGGPLAALFVIVVSDLASDHAPERSRSAVRAVAMAVLGLAVAYGLYRLGRGMGGLTISSGTNALNVSIILGIMALPTVVSVSEDALQAAGRELREGSYALGATRAETLIKVVIPAASSGICAAVILGVMRAVGETMVVWMASGNAAQIPKPWYNFLDPVRTLTATIAGDMGEADQMMGPGGTASMRYHVLFALALCLLVFCFVCNWVSEWAVRRTRLKMRA